MSAVWEIEGATLSLGRRKVLDGASLTCRSGEVVGIVGPNGAGKTSLLRAGLGLARLEAGRARLSGQALEALSDPARAALAGYLPQERRVGWNLAAEQIAALGAPNLPQVQALDVAREALARVGMADLAGRGVLDMSGGERARVLLARLLATRAPLLVADEPATGLDPDAQLLVMDIFREEAGRGAGVVLTLHNLGLAARSCDRLVVMHQGRCVAEGSPADALTPHVLESVFRLKGGLINTPQGRQLIVQRL